MKQKVIKLGAGVSNKIAHQIGDLMQSLTGVNSNNIKIAISNLVTVDYHIKRILECFRKFAKTAVCKEPHRKEIDEWISKAQAQMPIDAKMETIVAKNKVELVPVNTSEDFAYVNDKIKAFKSSQLIDDLLKLCTLTEPIAKNPDICEDILSKVDCKLFPFSSIDIKQVLLSCVSQTPGSEVAEENVRKYLAEMVKFLGKETRKVYEYFISPNIDPEDLSKVVTEQLNLLAKQMPECKKAIQMLNQSMHMLKQNFGEYYKAYVISNNPSTMITSFMSDVYKNSKQNHKLISQFGKIIAHFKQTSKAKIDMDPNIKKLVDYLEHVTNMEKYT